MSTRSITGCYGCKAMRKKCDETKPECLRCIKRGIECEYDYVQPKDQNSKKRTRPAPRPRNELIRAKQVALSSTSCQTTLATPVPVVDPIVLSRPRLSPPSSANAPPPFETTHYSIENVDFPPPAPVLSQPISTVSTMIAHDLTWNQYEFYDLSSSLGEDIVDESDAERIEPTRCIIPTLDRTADGNLLAFALQSYAQWISLTYFDPPKMMHDAKQVVIDRLTLSSPSRTRIILIAQLMDGIVKERFLDERSAKLLNLLKSTVLDTIVAPNLWNPTSDEVRKRATCALDNTLELLGILFATSSLSSALQLIKAITPVFLAGCPPPHPPPFLNIFVDYGTNLKHFTTADVVLSLVTGRATFCRYHVPWSLDLCEDLLERQKGQLRTEWLGGIPDQFVMLFAYMNGLREDIWNEASTRASNNYTHGTWDPFQNTPNWVSTEGNGNFEAEGAIGPEVIKKLENDLANIRILPYESTEPALKIVRMAAQECWREVGFIYLYMAICGADAQDPRVRCSQRKFMRLINGIQPGRNPDLFLALPMVTAGVAVTKPKDRRTITSRILSISEYSIPGTIGQDFVKILDNVWTRTAMEGRSACWGDLSVACQAITGL